MQAVIALSIITVRILSLLHQSSRYNWEDHILINCLFAFFLFSGKSSYFIEGGLNFSALKWNELHFFKVGQVYHYYEKKIR